MKKITLLIPVYNEEAMLPALYQRLIELINRNDTYEWEILFINDGSSDQTLDVIRRTDHAVLSLADGTGEPYGVPITPILLDGKIYFHGAGMGDGRRNADIQQNPRGSICWIAQDRTNQPKLSVDFVSAIASGPIRIIKDKAEKTAIMRKILERHTPSVDINKEMNARLEKIDKYTNVFEMKIEHLTGKAKDLGYLRFFGHNRPAQK